MIRVDNLRFSYDPGEEPDVLHGVSLTIADGEFVGLVGRNGSGKSSLARALNGLHLPTAGTVTVDGLRTTVSAELAELRRHIQMVFQNPENQQVGITVFEDIAFGLANIGLPGPLMMDRARQALAAAGLDVDLDRDVNALSGGQLQKLALASTLALEPRHLVLDEATSMLDPDSRTRFVSTLERLRAERSLTIVQITHHLEEVEHADRLLVLHEGVVRAEGTPREIFAQEDLLRECGLEAPYRYRSHGGTDISARPQPVSAEREGEPVLSARSVTLRYGSAGRRRRAKAATRSSGPAALANVSLDIRPGELLAIAGRSGAGKSTLITVLKGLLRPTDGVVEVAGVDPWATKSPELFDPIGYVFQYPEHQLFATTVSRDVAYGLTAEKLSEEIRATRVNAALSRVGLDPAVFSERSPFGLSGGQKRRVAFAGVLVTEPRVLIVDEPTAGLDLPSRAALFEILRALRDDGVTVIWVSHQLEEILEHGSRLVIVEDGEVTADGAPVDLLQRADLLERLGWPLLPQLEAAQLEIAQPELEIAQPELAGREPALREGATR